MGSERMLLVPSIYIFCTWLLFLKLSTVLPKIPDLPFMRRIRQRAVPLQKLLPILPKSLRQAYQAGRIDGLLSFYDGKTDAESSQAVAGILDEAAHIFGRPSVTVHEIQGIEDTIVTYEQDRGIVKRVRGFFTFVNLIWLLAIFGICISISPVMYRLAPPFMRLVTLLLDEFIIPFLKIWRPFYEGLVYFLCYLFMANGIKIRGEIGWFISLTGVMGFIPCFVYSTHLHATSGGDQILWLRIFHFLVAAELIPVAILHSSSVLGFAAVFASYGFLGYSVYSYNLCTYIRLPATDFLPIILLSSAIFMAVIVVIKAMRVPHSYIKPFVSGLVTMGIVLYFLAGLLMASRHYYGIFYYSERTMGQFYFMQFVMIISLLICFFSETLFQVPSFNNIASTFTVLYIYEKFVDLAYGIHDLFWFFTLGTSVALYMISLFLHHHPRFIISMFDGNWIPASSKANIV